MGDEQMVIFVKTAHFIRMGVYVRSKISNALSIAKPSLMIMADDALYGNEDAESWRKNELVHENVFDDIYPLCSKEDREVLKQSLHSGKTLRDFRSEVALSVQPCMKVGALKSLLKVHPWIPPKNLVLLQEKGSSPLEDDSATLADCGIMDRDSVLACMGGSFTVTIRDFDPELDPELDYEFVIPVSSCFEMVGDLKKKIHQKLGKDLDKMFLIHQFRTISENDDIPLVAHGIVRKYWSTLEETNVIKMYLHWSYFNKIAWGRPQKFSRGSDVQ